MPEWLRSFYGKCCAQRSKSLISLTHPHCFSWKEKRVIAITEKLFEKKGKPWPKFNGTRNTCNVFFRYPQRLGNN